MNQVSDSDTRSGSRLGTVLRMTLAEAVRRRLVLAVVVMGLLLLILFGVGFYFVHRETRMDPIAGRPEALNFFLLTGLYAVNFLTIVLTILCSVDTIAGEVQSGTIHCTLTRPLRRSVLLLGKWCGLAIMVSIFTLTMGAAMMGIVALLGSYHPPGAVQGLALMMLEGLVVLTLSLLGGTRFATLTNGVVIFMLYGLAFIAGWMEQIASFARNETVGNLGIVVSLLVPTEVLWRRAAWLMQPPLLRQLGLGPFATASAPSGTAVVYAGVYLIVVLLVAMRSFARRDL